ncbi:uncharacterized protein BP01DRAFT_305629 [Aspergillus saccharolyticus JOP 1030-1]|uniref:Mediator complex subunit 15 KIX domain-containing protein n=1 Tax=Aspergillus saccharolyticus JOP 1030-1 TaxID=1450539 RepID=A0A318Z2F0_9EURO|nr:hypothetical protein BP01DRAFT_305629 [Aspergillus saccharolyticus JOP 1030-1]PYH41475.1 hypothetical protein BP01DRAFT_305629 [Aspergillus saccharolyticus JOP 1030-1]
MNGGNNSQIILSQVGQLLQSQGPYSGWRAEVQVRDRAMKVYQMITSLRLIQPRIDTNSAAQAALAFEQKAFKDAREKTEYERNCNEKLVHIRDTRARQAAVMQNGMMPQGPTTGMPGVGQAGFPAQMNHPMQASPMPGQQQMSMSLGDLGQQGGMQHRPQPQQPQQQQQSQQQQQQQNIMQQRAQQRPAVGFPYNDELQTLSAQEYEQVCRVASQIISKTPQEDLEKIKLNLQNMSQEQRQYLVKKKMDPLTYFFRSQALTQLRRFKRNRMELARNQGAGVDPNGAAMLAETMNPQQRQMLMNLQRNSTFPMGNQPNPEPSFMGSIDNIQGQQAEGLRSQEAGQLVVPASSLPINTGSNMFPMNSQLGPNAQAGISPQFLAQHTQNAQNVSQGRPQQTSQLQTDTPPQQARINAAQRAQLAMTQGGQVGSQMQHQMAQSPAMSMLNRPMAPGQMSPAQVAAQVRPPSRAPGMGQQQANVQAMGGQPAMQRPQIPPGLPPAVQEHLSQMSTEQLNYIQQRAIANNQMLRQSRQQSMPMQQGFGQQGQGQQMLNGQMGNGQGIRAPLNLQQQIANMNGVQIPNHMLPGQQGSVQQQQQQRQHDMYKRQLLRQHSVGIEMSPEQTKEMDRVHFPPAILNNNPNISSPVPTHIKTWGQLKELASSNPQLLGGVDIQKLVALQKLHLAQILTQAKEGNRSAEQHGQGPWMPTQFQGQSQPFMNNQFTSGQQQPPINMPVMRPITPQDIQLARQRLGRQVQHLSDENLRDLLHKNRQKTILAQARAMAAAQQNQQPPTASQPPVTVHPTVPQVKLESQPSQPTAQQNQQNVPPKAQAAPSGKGNKASATKQAPKRKLPNEESMEAQATPVQKPNQPAPSQGGPAPVPNRPNMPFTREQLAAMTPQQRAQLELHLRRQQAQGRGSITRTAAEDSWNHLPERIGMMYEEIARTAPPAEPVPITPEQKATMSQQLRDSTDYLGRMDALVQFIAKIPGQERNVRSLLAMRIQLMRQFKSGSDWTLTDQFTITPEYLAGTTNYIKKLFHHMIARVNQQQNQVPGQRPNAPQGAPMAPGNLPNNMPALNATNLHQLQQQEEALQRARRASSQTASGPAGIPQAPFGAPSPQGVPHAYGPGSIPPEQLKLPPPKKRKQSHAGATPVLGSAVPKAPANKPTGAEMKMAGAPLSGAFKCSVPDCQNHHLGFATQSALDSHVEECHKVEEPIENPLEFAVESFRTALVKEEEQEGLQSSKDTSHAPGKSVAAFSSTRNDTKVGGTPVSTGATPMGRAPSQLGPKPSSPASNLQLTPRTSSAKVSTSSPLKPTTSKDDKKEAVKPLEPAPPSMDVTTVDPWANSALSLETIQDTFLDLGDDAGLGFGAMDEFLNPEMFTNSQAEDTPDSVETGLITQTPKDNDLPKSAETNGKVGEIVDENWIPVDWVNLPGRFEDGLLVNDPFEEIDWDMIDRKEAGMNVDDSGIAIIAM